MYRESATAKGLDIQKRPLESAFNSIFLLFYFTLLPILINIGVNWAVYSLTVNNFYQAFWMMPALILLSTFLAGALMRQKMEDEYGGIGLFFLGIVALGIFAWLTHQDIMSTGGIYSRFMPKLLRPSIEDYVFLLPAVGMFGMLFYRQFTLKHYS